MSREGIDEVRHERGGGVLCLRGELRAAHVGERVALAGWVRDERALGGQLTFLTLRDEHGLDIDAHDRAGRTPLVASAAADCASKRA